MSKKKKKLQHYLDELNKLKFCWAVDDKRMAVTKHELDSYVVGYRPIETESLVKRIYKELTEDRDNA
jgi:hypothetical protein